MKAKFVNESYFKNKGYDETLSVEEINKRILHSDKLELCHPIDALHGLPDNNYDILPYTIWYVDDPDNPCYNVMIQYDNKFIFSATNHFIIKGIKNWEEISNKNMILTNMENKNSIIKQFENFKDAINEMKKFLKKDIILCYDRKGKIIEDKNIFLNQN